MAEFIVEGGHKLKGSIIPQGSEERGIANCMRCPSYLRGGSNQ